MSERELVQLNKDEVERLRSLLSKLEKPTGNPMLVHLGTSLFSLPLGKSQFYFGFNASDKPFNQYWLMDSEATDHMTPLSTHFSTYSPCPSNKKYLLQMLPL